VTRRPPSYGTTRHSAEGGTGIYRGWAVVALCFAMLMLGAGPVYYAYGNYALAFAQSFNADRATINIGYTMVLLLGNLGSAPVGMMAERWPIRGVALLGVLGTAAGFALVSTASSILQVLLVFSTLIALADICIGTVVTNILVSHWFERRRGLAIGLSVIGTAVAAVIFPPLTDILFSRFGWRATFLIYAVLMLVLIPPIWFLARLPDSIAEHERLPLALRRPGGPPISLGEMFRSPAFWIVTLTIGAMIGANTGTMVSIVAFAVSRGFSSLEGSALLSAIGATSVAGKLAFGIAADRLSPVIALRIGLAHGIRSDRPCDRPALSGAVRGRDAVRLWPWRDAASLGRDRREDLWPGQLWTRTGMDARGDGPHQHGLPDIRRPDFRCDG